MAITAWSAKIFKQIDLLVRKGRTSVRRIMMAPMGTRFAQQRNGQHCSNSLMLNCRPDFRKSLCVPPAIVDVDNLSVDA